MIYLFSPIATYYNVEIVFAIILCLTLTQAYLFMDFN
jgi:hypothetical protein